MRSTAASRTPRPSALLWPALLVFCLLPVLAAMAARLALGDPPRLREVLIAGAFALAVALAAGLTGAVALNRSREWAWFTPAAGAVGLALLLIGPAREITLLSYVAVGCLWVYLLHLAFSLANWKLGWRLLGSAALAACAGFLPIAVLQWHERFSTEEAFAAIQVVVLALAFLLALLPAALVARHAGPHTSPPAFTLRRRWLFAVTAAAALVIAVVTLVQYQASFFDPSPPARPGITEQTPFECLPAPADRSTYDGQVVFERLVSAVARNPSKQAPEYGMLALTTGEVGWAQRFHDALLDEARSGKFTEPSNSVKYTQYEASLRAYYFPRVETAFPDLFSASDEQLLHNWFAAVNRRALTVEWSDWIYASALGAWPTGLYENQENGAGLLANLISGRLEAPDLSVANRQYLDSHVRGWAARFRNTDDAFIYQPEWINNAYFQSLAGQPVDARREALSFEWLLLQAQPGGQPAAYNFPNQPSLAGVAYEGALLLQDPRYVWLAGRALDEAEQSGRLVFARPGVERAATLTGAAPAQGSCLIYADSGLPTRGGPLAPDKIVLRSGWDEGDSYALVNLRFTGWHRYKATNTISAISFGQTVTGDQPRRAAISWLPEGRSLLRDKRVPREDLNGLLVPARGLSAALVTLTGVGSPWAEDPPWHAQVVGFGQTGNWDSAATRVDDWHGWDHTRYTYLLHGGDVVVVADDARGPGGAPALAWRLDGEGWTTGATGDAERPVAGAGSQRIVLFAGAALSHTSSHVLSDAGQRASLAYRSPESGSLRAVTVFLANQAVEADVRIEPGESGPRLVIRNGDDVETLALFNTVR